MRGNQCKRLGLLHYLINKGDLPEGKVIHEQLAKMDIQPEDLDYVILSNMHSDHTDVLKLVQSAKKILASKEEWQSTLDDPKRYVKKNAMVYLYKQLNTLSMSILML